MQTPQPFKLLINVYGGENVHEIFREESMGCLGDRMSYIMYTVHPDVSASYS